MVGWEDKVGRLGLILRVFRLVEEGYYLVMFRVKVLVLGKKWLEDGEVGDIGIVFNFEGYGVGWEVERVR